MGIEGPKERATFSIAASVKGQLDRMVPKSKRSSFVEAALADALRKEAVAQLKQTLERFKGYSSGGEDSADVLRRLRQERGDYLAERHRAKR
jgi:uncharacterized protein YgbK (DUF1537 family)